VQNIINKDLNKYTEVTMRINKPAQVTIPEKTQKQILKYFHEISKDAKRLASMTLTPRPQVMLFLEQQGLRKYSMGSYWC